MDKFKLNFRKSANVPVEKKEKNYEEDLTYFLRMHALKSKVDIDPSKDLFLIFRLPSKKEAHLYKTSSWDEILALWTDYRTNTLKYGHIFSLKINYEDALKECNKTRGPIGAYSLVDHTIDTNEVKE